MIPVAIAIHSANTTPANFHLLQVFLECLLPGLSCSSCSSSTPPSSCTQYYRLTCRNRRMKTTIVIVQWNINGLRNTREVHHHLHHHQIASTASTQSRCDPWYTRRECQKVCRRRFIEASSCVGDLFAGANRDGRSQF